MRRCGSYLLPPPCRVSPLRHSFSTTPKPPSYYTVLEIDDTATPEQIKSAYLNLAKQLHPDTEQGDNQRFQEVKKAYEVLSDKKKKEEYDDSLLTDDEYYRLFGLDLRYIFVFSLMLMSMKSIRDRNASQGKCPINH